MRVAIIGVFLASCGGDGTRATDAASSDDTLPPVRLGSVTVVGNCQRTSMLPRTTCMRVSVASPNVAALTADVAITSPPTGVTVRGTVVFGTGGGGGGFYEIDAVARAMLQRLSDNGWLIVQRGWDGTLGWPTGPGGMLALSNRYATLVTWVRDTIHDGGVSKPFCVTGNSGGSAEISYALARWQRGDIIDLAMPTAGPPIVALDHFCLDGGDPTWVSQCQALVPPSTFQCGANPPWCAYSMGQGPRTLIDAAYTPATPCGSLDQSARGMLLGDSVVAPDAVYGYPNTRVEMIFGKQDCSEAVPGGHLYAAQITSEHAIRYIDNTPHPVFSTAAGAAAIEDAINTSCVTRH